MLTVYNRIKENTALIAVALMLALASPSAFAFDLAGTQTTILGYIAATTAFIVAIGLAVVLLVLTAKAVRYARRAG